MVRVRQRQILGVKARRQNVIPAGRPKTGTM